ncbi:MAG: PRD domain-containing protein [Eubacteriales bacterium]|nr:PRD domain-containing protein [Eubacteriales bacterium]
MRIHRVLNNNVAVVLDERGREQIVMGRGVCFKKKPGDMVDPSVIDKTFVLEEQETRNKFQVLIQDVPLEHMAVGEEIIAEAKSQLGKELNDMIYISLIDHVHTSIVRFQGGVTVKNVLLWDIRRFYREEFSLGLWALNRIEETIGVRLPEDEAGFIALHLANAEMDQEVMHNMYAITQVMQEVTNIVKYYFRVNFHDDDVYYYRFITHLKFFAKRLVEHKIYQDEGDEELWLMIRGKYGEAARCVDKIAGFIAQKYEYELSREEQMYLIIHIERLVGRAKKS